MARVRLAEDHAPRGPDGGVAWSLPVALDEDVPGRACGGGCGAADDGHLVGEVFVVRARDRSHYTPDGDPRYEWADVGEGRGILHETRKETDDASGNTTVSGQLTMAWGERDTPTETAVVDSPDGLRWRITAVAPLPGALRLTVERNDDAR